MNKEQLVKQLDALINELKEVNKKIETAKTEAKKEQYYHEHHILAMVTESSISQLEDIDFVLFTNYNGKLEDLM